MSIASLLDRGRGKEDSWPGDCSVDYRQDPVDSATNTDSLESPKELYGREKTGLRVRRGGSRVLEGISFQGDSSFRQEGKLSPRYIGPFEVLKRVGLVAYRIALPLELSQVHNVFHVSMLRK